MKRQRSQISFLFAGQSLHREGPRHDLAVIPPLPGGQHFVMVAHDRVALASQQRLNDFAGLSAVADAIPAEEDLIDLLSSKRFQCVEQAGPVPVGVAKESQLHGDTSPEASRRSSASFTFRSPS